MRPEQLTKALELAGDRKITLVHEGKEVSPEFHKTMAEVFFSLVKGEQIRDRAVIDNLTSEVKSLKEQIEELQKTTKEVVESNGFVLKAIANLDSTLRLPVEPVRDAKGRLIGAKRVENLK